MIYCSVKYCCSNSSMPKVILHSIMKSIKTPNHPAYHWSTLWPLEVWVRGLYDSWWFCVHKLYLCLFIYLWNLLNHLNFDSLHHYFIERITYPIAHSPTLITWEVFIISGSGLSWAQNLIQDIFMKPSFGNRVSQFCKYLNNFA